EVGLEAQSESSSLAHLVLPEAEEVEKDSTMPAPHIPPIPKGEVREPTSPIGHDSYRHGKGNSIVDEDSGITTATDGQIF
ncbi:hypothetical protein HAX54_023759, partial [Datura stramonium]|nr:hypothetical protein [Datura stramonium]